MTEAAGRRSWKLMIGWNLKASPDPKGYETRGKPLKTLMAQAVIRETACAISAARKGIRYVRAGKGSRFRTLAASMWVCGICLSEEAR